MSLPARGAWIEIDTYVYLALKGRSVLGDLSMSRAVKESGVLDLRIPMVTSYSAKQDTSNLPPQAEPDKGGRPSKTIEDVKSGNIADGGEDDLDVDGGLE